MNYKNIFFLTAITFFLSFTSLQAQSIRALNKMNGFRFFTIGESRNAFKDSLWNFVDAEKFLTTDLHLKNPGNGKAAAYVYQQAGNAQFEAFGVPMDETFLTFDSKQELAVILIRKLYDSLSVDPAAHGIISDQVTVVKQLTSLYGKPNKFILATAVNPVSYYRWSGSKINLEGTFHLQNGPIASYLEIKISQKTFQKANELVAAVPARN